ncbi:MAG: hypothetical protein D3920_04125 [Candidatus Electrothrix sp. AW2]|nr:hypothetical protein [Candidatus Electrothrix sp. AX1]MCI5134259.1 hypothetical protein [Candidatus Electrothrix gigas]MCI5182531.1 hypothetical protein [Candidatus Electrothrix gigas]
MNLLFTESAWTDYVWFQENDRRLLKRVNDRIRLIVPSEIPPEAE